MMCKETCGCFLSSFAGFLHLIDIDIDTFN